METLHDSELANIYGVNDGETDDGWTEEALEELQEIINEENANGVNQ